MGLLDKNKEPGETKAAKEAFEQGRTIFIWESKKIVGDGTDAAAKVVESIETAGWKLSDMSYYFDERGFKRAIGVFLFRRAA